jgi:hypothetical protein
MDGNQEREPEQGAQPDAAPPQAARLPHELSCNWEAPPAGQCAVAYSDDPEIRCNRTAGHAGPHKHRCFTVKLAWPAQAEAGEAPRPERSPDRILSDLVIELLAAAGEVKRLQRIERLALALVEVTERLAPHTYFQSNDIAAAAQALRQAVRS